MDIKIKNFDALEVDRRGKLTYWKRPIDRWWGKTLYKVEGDTLVCKRFNPVQLFLHLFGYQADFKSKNLTDYLQKNIKSLPQFDRITQKVALEALGKVQKLKFHYFNECKTDAEALAFFKANRLNPNLIDVRTGHTALMHALLNKYFELAKYLVENHADLNIRRASRTALHSAIESKHPESIQLLIERGADLNSKGVYGNSAFLELLNLYFSSKEEEKDALFRIVQEALKKKPDLSTPYHLAMDTDALSKACRKGDINMAKLLIENGAAIDTGIKGYTWHLQRAIQSGNVEMVRWLLDEQKLKFFIPEDLNVQSPITAALGAPQHLISDMLKFLLSRGVPVNRDQILSDLVTAVTTGNLEAVKIIYGQGGKEEHPDLEFAIEMAKTYLETIKTEKYEEIVAFLESKR